jgi:hypothetical protein
VRAHSRIAESRIVSSGYEEFRTSMLGTAAVLPPSHEPIVPHDAQILVALQQELI